MRTYTELKDGSCSVTIVLWNLTAQPIHLARGRVVGQVVATNAAPKAQCSPDLLKKLDEEDSERPEPVKLTIPQREELLLATVKKDGGLDCLKEWLPELAQKAVALLLEFNHVFSLEPNEIGCMDATEHVIKPGTKGLKSIAEIASLATYTQVCKFLGTTSYFRCFIKGYVKSLNDLLQGENSKFKSQLLELLPDALVAFQELKMKCLMVSVNRRIGGHLVTKAR